MNVGISLAGIPAPWREPWFLATGIHVLAGLIAVVAGGTAMVSPKAPGRHPRAGTLCCRVLATTCATMGALAVARWPADNHLVALGVRALGSAIMEPALGGQIGADV